MLPLVLGGAALQRRVNESLMTGFSPCGNRNAGSQLRLYRIPIGIVILSDLFQPRPEVEP